MIRGIVYLNLTNRFRVPLLASLIVLGCGLADISAEPLDVETFAADLSGKTLAITSSRFPARAQLNPDGTVDIESALGSFQGEWSGQGREVCFFFENGPRMGESCVSFQRARDGRLHASNRTILQPIGPERAF